MPRLSIRTLGSLSIQKDNKRLDARLSDKAVAMICLLLSSEGQKLSKNKIINYFWGDSDETASRSNLRYNLWNIKKIITEDENGEDFILTDKSTVFINQRFDFWCDIVQLKQFDKNKLWTIKELKDFVFLFKGEYMEGFYIKGCPEYSDTILFERISCQMLQISVLEQLYERYRQKEDFDNCNSVLKELLYIDPFQEKYVRELMENYVKQNQYAQAVSYYRNFDDKLRKNLNISPSKSLKAFYHRICGQGSELLRENPVFHRTVRTFCLPSVEYFWMSECLSQILEHTDCGFLNELDKSCIFDLSGIQSRLLEKTDLSVSGRDSIPPVRLLFSFCRFLECCAETQPLEIIVEGFQQMDSSSRAFFDYVKKKPVKNLVLTVRE